MKDLFIIGKLENKSLNTLVNGISALSAGYAFKIMGFIKNVKE